LLGFAKQVPQDSGFPVSDRVHVLTESGLRCLGFKLVHYGCFQALLGDGTVLCSAVPEERQNGLVLCLGYLQVAFELVESGLQGEYLGVGNPEEELEHCLPLRVEIRVLAVRDIPVDL
jgi:hypothetical protein